MAINRRNFLALIPSLSALPFIGKDIYQKNDKIIIHNPEIVKIQNVPPSLGLIESFKDLELCLVNKKTGEVLANGYLTELSIQDDPMSYLRDDGSIGYIPGVPRNVSIEGQLYNFHL